jgi:spheroidene monooxygenase
MTATVSVHIVALPWSLSWRGLTQVGKDKRTLRHLPGVRFAVNGRSSGGSGTRDISATVTGRREVVLVEWDSADAAAAGRAQLLDGWRARGADVWSASLSPFRSNGTWNGGPAFTPAADAATALAAGDVAAVLTYARVKPSKMFDFYVRAFPKTARYAVGPDSGMLAGIGFGTVPIRDACTLSFWPDVATAAAFAYGNDGPHGDAQRRSHQGDWMSESLFARFTVIDHDGVWGGRDPLAPALR